MNHIVTDENGDEAGEETRKRNMHQDSEDQGIVDFEAVKLRLSPGKGTVIIAAPPSTKIKDDAIEGNETDCQGPAEDSEGAIKEKETYIQTRGISQQVNTMQMKKKK